MNALISPTAADIRKAGCSRASESVWQVPNQMLSDDSLSLWLVKASGLMNPYTPKDLSDS